MLTKERIVEVLQTQGPSLPVQIKKGVGEGDTFMIGALLTELRSAGKIKVSNVKRGGSPFYYVPEHRAKLAAFISDLGEKERRAAVKLQQEKILRDSAQEPLTRVCLRQIKDYAMPVEVKTKSGVELFWKWYLVPSEETEGLIRKALGMEAKKPEVAPLVEEKAASVEPVREVPTQAAAPVVESTPVVPQEREGPREQQIEPEEEPRPQAAAAILKEVDDTGDSFLKQVREYFAEKHIQVITKEVLRKNSDIEMTVSVPSAVGRVEYYCKAKSKKKNNDGDLSSAFVQGQLKKLPVLYVTTGEVTKKAQDMLGKEFKGLVLVRL